MNSKRNSIIVGLSGALAVSLGALGAHALKNQLPSGLITQDQLIGFDTAVKYQMYHTIVMLALIIWNNQTPNKFLYFTFNLFLTGIILFSGSLYFLTTRHLIGMDGLKFLGPVTPLGGLCFVAGWLCLVYSAIKKG